ncbi:23S rRNA methyltransferase [Photobacterium iliopiscarium]|jgi:tRNA(Leu) C34 or U34 (ribose-2'-O)-methylase TrmL|uniref:23S rRNA methyltransferase n=1 Tax=Photobacterium iliopiscarium TaxID=56192 RepID=A0A0D8P8F1_9GAMM|nr:RNA methyltransferase [Photobacterium iliopiscarium]KJG14157.1 23S rRNA methyltransferase [Photobacterium iliopiscarium]KJG24107.1 23S rRNA methyltransferase [Photobacterium iliopiscarium]PST94041.1 23S rRNA methyltransferase [Photobacterium iliopiscarium]PSU00687.1 23S rRNA methyltransferase [Photobacterium iliopiscarium]PSV82373.1 23S rRNA methyltransferase [Photobacterium iliopiscarium]
MKDASVIIGLSNPKSPTNIGAVLRAAGCYKADAVIYTGTRYDKAAKFQTDTKKMAQTIPLSGVESMLDNLPKDMKIVCVDFAEGATLLPHFQHPDKAIYIFGPEDGSISQDVADRADHVVYVPTVGCMNLAASVNVVLYDRLAKQENIIQSDEHIRQNRDNKNNLRVSTK